MLKIKDNVELKELEKLGFKYIEDKSSKGDFSYCEKLIGSNIILGVSEPGRVIYSNITITETTYIFSDGLDVIFDLIQAGLVEKVKGR